MLKYQLAENGKKGGGSEVAASTNVFFNGGAISTSRPKIPRRHRQARHSHEGARLHMEQRRCQGFRSRQRKEQEGVTTDSKGKKTKVTRYVIPELASTKLVGVESMMKAGSRLYFGGKDFVTVLDWDDANNKLSPSWTLKLDGLAVAHDRR